MTALVIVSLPTTMRAAGTKQADPEQIEFFERNIRPLLHKHCVECHSTAKGKENGGLVLDSSAGLRAGGSRGSVLHPGKPQSSLLYRAVTYKDAGLQMPPDGKLSEKEVRTLRLWIERGGLFPEYGGALPGTETRSVDIEAGRRFWSFLPLATRLPPETSRTARVRTPVDRFILAKRKQTLAETTSWFPPAESRVIVRRVHFDAIGLPPTPTATAEFVNDDTPDAFERLVDRLLASPRYGEHRGRAWLDLARYTDTTASWLKSMGQAWLYRDWVVRAMNEDLPYDRFVRLQLAADLMTDVDPRDQAALGLLGLSPTYWKEPRLSPEVIRTVVAEEWDERIDAMSRTFLGLTIACARCHDHKFDPITSQDYYALAGVFASTQLSDRALRPEPQATQIRTAHNRVSELKERLKTFKDRTSDEAKNVQAEIDRITRETDDFHAPQAHVVYDAAIYVHPDGEDKTRLEYRAGEPRDLPVFRRGNPENKGPVTPRRFPVVLTRHEPSPFRVGSGRLELADAILTDAHPLAARVIVNRVWEQLFGQGIVRTPSNFGSQGERPTHPQLLDHLAAELIRHNWSLKWLQRTLICSAVYRQTVDHDDAMHRLDPENRLLWRMNRRRLGIEAWRDAMLFVSGHLDDRIGGAPGSLDESGNHRRTIYGIIARRDLNRILRLYDFPEPTSHAPRREPTTTPLQQLFVLNGPLVRGQAAFLANRIVVERESTDERIRYLYELLFARPPSSDELSLGREFVGRSSTGPSQSELDCWNDYTRTLLGLNEFLYLD